MLLHALSLPCLLGIYKNLHHHYLKNCPIKGSKALVRFGYNKKNPFKNKTLFYTLMVRMRTFTYYEPLEYLVEDCMES